METRHKHVPRGRHGLAIRCLLNDRTGKYVRSILDKDRLYLATRKATGDPTNFRNDRPATNSNFGAMGTSPPTPVCAWTTWRRKGISKHSKL